VLSVLSASAAQYLHPLSNFKLSLTSLRMFPDRVTPSRCGPQPALGPLWIQHSTIEGCRTSEDSVDTVHCTPQPRLYPTLAWLIPPSRFGSRPFGGNQAYLARKTSWLPTSTSFRTGSILPCPAPSGCNHIAQRAAHLKPTSQLSPMAARWGRGSYGLLHLHSCNLRCGWPRG
jgi:hypothetical protein